MATVTDSFTYSNGVLPTVSSSRWANKNTATAQNVLSNAVWFQYSAHGTAIDTTVSPGADQTAEVAVSGMASASGYVGVCARHNGQTNASANYYVVRLVKITASTVDVMLLKMTGGASANLWGAAINVSWTDGDVIRLIATGTSTTSLSVYRVSGGTPTQIGTTYDDSSSPFTSGSVGIYGYGGSSSGFLADDWSGGDYADGASAVAKRSMLLGIG